MLDPFFDKTTLSLPKYVPPRTMYMNNLSDGDGANCTNGSGNAVCTGTGNTATSNCTANGNTATSNCYSNGSHALLCSNGSTPDG